MLFTACDNVGMASVFYPDEGRYITVIRAGLEANTLHIHFVSYGHFFFNLVLIPLLFAQQFVEVTDVHILMGLRLVSWTFGLLSVWMIFVLGGRFFGRFVAWASAVMMLVLPLTVLEYSTVAHPDTLQLFFTIASLYAICLLAERLDVKYLLWASAMAGLAFSAKYGGLLLIPLIAYVFFKQLYHTEKLEVKTFVYRRLQWLIGGIALVCIFGRLLLQRSIIEALFSSDGAIESDWIWQVIGWVRVGLLILAVVFGMVFYLYWRKFWISKFKKISFAAYYGFGAIVAFISAFVLTSPNSLLGLQFVQGLLYEGHNTQTGGFFTAEFLDTLQQWSVVLTSEYLMGVGFFAMGLVGSIWGVFLRWEK